MDACRLRQDLAHLITGEHNWKAFEMIGALDGDMDVREIDSEHLAVRKQ